MIRTATLASRWMGVGGIFGGAVLAQFVREASVIDGFAPLSLTVHFVSTVAAGAAEVATEVVHRGRSTASLRVEIRQEGRVRAHALALAAPIGEAVVWTGRRDMSSLSAPETYGLMEGLPHRMPFYDALEIRSSRPYTVEGGSAAWIRMIDADAERELGGPRASAALVLDVLPPSLLAGDRPAYFVPTIEFTAHFSPAIASLEPGGWMHVTNVMVWHDGDYCVEESTLCLPDGRVLAQVRQSRGVRWAPAGQSVATASTD